MGIVPTNRYYFCMQPLPHSIPCVRHVSGKLLGLVALAVLVGCSMPGYSEPPKLATPPPPVAAAPKSADAKPAAAQSLFDGKTLKGWAVTDFAGKGEVRVEEGRLILEQGVMTGVTWTSDIPKMNYEVTLDAMRVAGSDFFCGLTFPVGKDPCSLIVGGWGGGTVGLSTLDGEDAANNETTKYMNFKSGQWFAVRLRVTPGKIQAWIDEDKVVDVETTGKKLDVRFEMELSRPFGLASWGTKAALRNIQIRRL